MSVYSFRPGRSLKNINPQLVGEELENIQQEFGKINAELVLEKATSEDSPLHDAFEWDDSAAAREHRLNQARRLITSIRILNGPTAKPTVAFVSVRTPENGRSYVPTIEALADDDLAARVLQDVKQAIENLERKYASFSQARELLADLKKKVG